MCLQYHPDKNESKDDTIFKKIQEAYDVINNPNKRKMYDSRQEDVPEVIPTEIPPDSDFYKTFGIVFDRFSKWSINPNVPELGNENTLMSRVRTFYKFWGSFKSWRDFSFACEYDLEEAESRDERRWMEKQNKKQTEKKKKEEKAKINKLVDTAYNLDPRIRRMKEQEEAERNRIKKLKAEAAQRREEEKDKLNLNVKEKSKKNVQKLKKQ